MTTFEINDPDIWRDYLPKLKPDDHKYKRGFCVIVGAPELTGASRLAAVTALNSGVGLIRLIVQNRADVYRMTLPADIMVTSNWDMTDKRVTALLAGPGGLAPQDRDSLFEPYPFPLILDSAALPTPDELPLKTKALLTPHGGEFSRLFPDLNSKEPKEVLAAAKRANAVIIAKGACTLIASPEGRLVQHDAPNPILARGGTGDVLAGLVTGLIAQNMTIFEAASAAVWIHSEAAKGQGHSFTASHLAKHIAPIVDDLMTY